MPSLSINKKDLDELGISIKDILKAITKTGKNDDVIKIKRKRKKKKTKKPKLNEIAKKPTFTNYPSNGGGGFYSSQPIYNNPDNKQDDSARRLEEHKNNIYGKIEDLKIDNEKKLTNFQSMNHLGLRLIYDKIDESQPNKTDRFGIIPTNNFYDDSNRVEILEDAEPAPPINETAIQPEPDRVDFETALEQEIQKEEKKKAGRPKGSKNKPKHSLTRDAIAEDMALPNTRSSLADLINPEMATPDRYAREQMKKQEEISKYFTPRRVAERKPIAVIPEDDEEEPIFEINTRAPPPRVPPTTSGIVPTPPTTEKPSKFKSRLPTRAKSDSMVFG
jgi:hypothetical protein